MTKIIVTGGLGFIGSNLIGSLLKKKFKVLNIDKVTYASNFYNTRDFQRNKNYSFKKCDLKNLNQLKKIINLKFDRILFDNMSPKTLKKGIKLSKKLYETEASGGITLKNVKKIAATGVERISIGSITHSAPALDLKLQI